jgi:hypothetical protein
MGICDKLSEDVMGGWGGLTKPFRWRKVDNPWRQAPFSVTNLPTIIKVTADGVSQLSPQTTSARIRQDCLCFDRNGRS